MQPGTQLGAYRAIERIGSGGMGEVWVAEHETLGRRAAVKVLHPAFSGQPDVVGRFFNEARAATAIPDPGIVQIFDFGHQDGNAYIVMELLNGEPLDRRLDRAGPLPLRDALRITRQVASSLEAAHTRGIVHRDLKPENIFLVRDSEVVGGERPKILDFGIAKLVSDQPDALRTKTAALLGTPTYMSPEQCRGAGFVDHRSDLYSLGCVLFTLVTGRPPFESEGSGDLIAMHLREPAPLVSSRVPGAPRELDALVARYLSKAPGDRFASAGELAAALAALAGKLSVAALDAAARPTRGAPAVAEAGGTRLLPSGAGGPTANTTTLSSAATESGVPRGRRRTSLIIGLVGLVGIAAIAVIVLGSRTTSNPTVETPPAVVATPPSAALPPQPASPPPAAAASPAAAPVPVPPRWPAAPSGGSAPPVPGAQPVDSRPAKVEPRAGEPAPNAPALPRHRKHVATAKAQPVKKAAHDDDDIPDTR